VLVLFLVPPLLVLRPLGTEPWESDPALTAAVEEARSMHRQAAAATPRPLSAGWAAVPLAIAEGEPLAGYGARRGAPSEPGGEPLYARAVALRAGGAEIVLVTADVLLIPPLVAAAVAERCEAAGLAPDSLYFLATHTHAGPGGWARGPLEESVCGKYDPEAVDRLAAALSEAAVAAIEAQAPAEWAWIRREVPEGVSNRTVRGGEIDPWLDALALRRREDGALGLFAIYGAHATCHGPDLRTRSADYPGAMVRRLESEGITFAAFGSGAVGSQSPRGEGSGAARAEWLGNRLAETLLEEVGHLDWRSEVALGSARRQLSIPRPRLRVGRRWRTADWAGRLLHGPDAPFHVARFDEVWIAGLPVEFSAMLSAPLREEAVEAGRWFCATVFNGDYLGYVLPDEHYHGDTYEAGMNFLGPSGGSYCSALVRALCRLGEEETPRP